MYCSGLAEVNALMVNCRGVTGKLTAGQVWIFKLESELCYLPLVKYGKIIVCFLTTILSLATCVLQVYLPALIIQSCLFYKNIF